MDHEDWDLKWLFEVYGGDLPGEPLYTDQIMQCLDLEDEAVNGFLSSVEQKTAGEDAG